MMRNLLTLFLFCILCLYYSKATTISIRCLANPAQSGTGSQINFSPSTNSYYEICDGIAATYVSTTLDTGEYSKTLTASYNQGGLPNDASIITGSINILVDVPNGPGTTFKLIVELKTGSTILFATPANGQALTSNNQFTVSYTLSTMPNIAQIQADGLTLTIQAKYTGPSPKSIRILGANIDLGYDSASSGGKGDKGNKGDTGAKGDKGSKGDTGAPGSGGGAGPAGSKGDKGSRGDKGDKGNTGNKGDKGNTGNKGDKGNKGDAAAKGDKGSKGDTGAPGSGGGAGPTGSKGDKGSKGNTADKGDKGSKGDQGLKGESGSAAARGDKGDKGNKGDRGLNGLDGLNGAPGYIYHIFRENGWFGDRDGDDNDGDRGRDKRSLKFQRNEPLVEKKLQKDDQEITQLKKIVSEIPQLKQQVQAENLSNDHLKQQVSQLTEKLQQEDKEMKDQKNRQQRQIDELQDELKSLLKKIRV